MELNMNRNVIAALGLIVQAVAGIAATYTTSQAAKTEINTLKDDVLGLKFSMRDLKLTVDKISTKQDVNSRRVPSPIPEQHDE